MRTRAGDSWDEPKSRRRGRKTRATGQSGHPEPAPRPDAATGSAGSASRHDPQPRDGARAGRHSAGGTVFTPGYSRRGPDAAPAGPDAAEARRVQSGYWSGGPDGTAGKGPVRGFPPAPGQGPPLYPPGQFAAWNRRRDAHPAGPEAAARGTGSAAVEPPPGPDSGSGVGAEPGYPVLAVSDPAADVTSTQTWRAVADGRSTGTWTAPAGLREDGLGQPARSAAGLPVRTPGRSGAPAGPARAAITGPNPRITTGPNPRITTGPNPRITTGPRTVPADPGTRRPPAGGRRAAARTRRGRGRPTSVHVAIAAALLLVLAAAGTLAYTVLHRSRTPTPAAQTARNSSPSASPSPSLGPYGHIASRQSDPLPLTLAQLYPASFTMAGVSVVSTATNLSSNCVNAIVGAKLQSAVGAAGCTQVARATYLDATGSLMGTIGVLNLSTGDKAKAAAQAADANDFISQLPGPRGPTQKIGQGTGIEEAAAKGHYLILIWAEFTNVSKPKTTQQSAEIENFMTGLLQNTVNVTLTTRMLTGAP